jgi:Outer membrane protein beta-barrel domain
VGQHLNRQNQKEIHLKIAGAALLGLFLLFGTTTFAQDSPKMEVSGDYSYMRFNPQNNNISGLGAFSLNGGGGAFTYFLTNMIGIKAEFEGYGSTTRTFPGGAPVSGNLFTYNVGPEIKFRIPHVQPFAEAMFGGAHSNAFVNICNVGGGCIGNPSNNAFDFIIGGGVDIPVGKSIAIRAVEADYVLTRFGNSFTGGNNNQSNFRIQAGVVFSF